MKLISPLNVFAASCGSFLSSAKPAINTVNATKGPRPRSELKLSAAARLAALVSLKTVHVIESTRIVAYVHPRIELSRKCAVVQISLRQRWTNRTPSPLRFGSVLAIRRRKSSLREQRVSDVAETT